MDIGDFRFDCKGLGIVDLSSVSLELNQICYHFLGSWGMKKSSTHAMVLTLESFELVFNAMRKHKAKALN